MSEATVATRNRNLGSRLTTFLLGIASGLATNLLSGSIAYRVLAGIITLVSVLSAATWLHGMSPRAPLVRYGVRAIVMFSLAASVGAIVGPPGRTPYLIFVSVVLTSGAVMIHTDPVRRWRMLLGVAVVGVAMASVNLGVARMIHGDTQPGLGILSFGAAACLVPAAVHRSNRLRGVTFAGVGFMLIGLGIFRLVTGELLIGTASVLFGVGLVYFGAIQVIVHGLLSVAVTASPPARDPGRTDLLAVVATAGGAVALVGLGVVEQVRDDEYLRALSLIAGVAILGAAISRLLDSNLWAGVASVGFGVTVAGVGGAVLLRGDLPLGISILGIGMTVSAFGFARWSKSELVDGTATVGFGLAIIGVGGAVLLRPDLPLGMAVVGVGAAIVGVGLVIVRRTGGAKRAKAWFVYLTQDPDLRIHSRE